MQDLNVTILYHEERPMGGYLTVCNVLGGGYFLLGKWKLTVWSGGVA